MNLINLINLSCLLMRKWGILSEKLIFHELYSCRKLMCSELDVILQGSSYTGVEHFGFIVSCDREMF